MQMIFETFALHFPNPAISRVWQLHPFLLTFSSLLSSALFQSRITDCAWSISRGLASMYNSTSWHRNEEDMLQKWMQIQLKVAALWRQTYCKHSLQLGWFMEWNFPIASSILNYSSKCHHLTMNHYGLKRHGTIIKFQEYPNILYIPNPLSSELLYHYFPV